MAIQAERARWSEGRRRQAWGAAAGLAVAAIGGALGAIYLAPPLPAANLETALLIILSLGGIAVVAAVAARWVHGALVGRVDILSQALDASPDAHLVVAADGRMAYANTAFESLFPGDDRPVERIARALVEEPEAKADFERLLSRAAAGARAIAAVPLRGPRGGVAGWFNVSVNPIAGRPGYCFWNIQDVTARHEMEALIRDERNKLVDFLDNAPIGFYSVDGSGRFLFVNQTLARWLGDTPQQIVASGARLHDFLAAPPPPGTAPADPFGGEDDGAQRGEVVLKGRQGRIVHAWIGQSAVGSGDELRTRSVVRDLTPEREWETALRRSRERFQRFFADAPVGIALLDRRGRFAEANAAVGELFGALPQELIGEKLADFVHEEDRRELAARLAATVEADELPLGPIEVRLTGARERTMAVFPRRLEEAAEDEGGLIVHVIDVTEQKSLEIQFAQSQKMQAVGQLAGGVAHDFNNLLTAMIGFCDLLLLRFHPGDPSFGDIMQIKQNANRAANLVRQLLAFSRQQALQPRVLDITDILVELSHLLRRLIGEKIELNVVHARDLGLAKVDQGQLEQVIINLAVNARDAMPNGGQLTIRTASLSQPHPLRRGLEVLPSGEYVLIEVADTGIGIAREHLGRIFEPFFSTKEIGSGTGLGLSTVYGIVKQTGGFIFVDSAPGQGATFQIYLPRHRQEEERPAHRGEAAEPAAGRDLTGAGTVMLVEDDDPVRIFGARALRNKGYSVIEAKSGEAALELIRDAPQKIDLLITDVVMPQMDGPELVHAVREFDDVIKVIFISGYAETAFRERLGSDSDIHFLPKPFNLKQLAAKVKEVMSGEAA